MQYPGLDRARPNDDRSAPYTKEVETLAKKPKLKLPESDGPYMTINIIARRAREINKQRANELYDENQPDPVDVAKNEYDNDLLNYEFRHHLTGTGEDFRSQ